MVLQEEKQGSGGWVLQKERPSSLLENRPLREAYCARGYHRWAGVKHSVHFYKTHRGTRDFTWTSHTAMREANARQQGVGNKEIWRGGRESIYTEETLAFFVPSSGTIGRDSVSSLLKRLGGVVGSSGDGSGGVGGGSSGGSGDGGGSGGNRRCVSRRMLNSVNSLPDGSGEGERGAGLHRVRRSASFLRETNPQGQYTAKSIYSGLTCHASFQKFKM